MALPFSSFTIVINPTYGSHYRNKNHCSHHYSMWQWHSRHWIGTALSSQYNHCRHHNSEYLRYLCTNFNDAAIVSDQLLGWDGKSWVPNVHCLETDLVRRSLLVCYLVWRVGHMIILSDWEPLNVHQIYHQRRIHTLCIEVWEQAKVTLWQSKSDI